MWILKILFFFVFQDYLFFYFLCNAYEDRQQNLLYSPTKAAQKKDKKKNYRLNHFILYLLIIIDLNKNCCYSLKVLFKQTIQRFKRLPHHLKDPELLFWLLCRKLSRLRPFERWVQTFCFRFSSDGTSASPCCTRNLSWWCSSKQPAKNICPRNFTFVLCFWWIGLLF